MLALAVHTEDGARAESFCFDAVKAAVASDIEQALAAKIFGQALPNDLPGWLRMLDRFAHHTLGFREQAVTEIDAMEPGLEDLETVENFRASHGVIGFCASRPQM